MTTPFYARAVGSSAPHPFDTSEARRALLLLADATAGIELRALPSGRSVVAPAADLDSLLGVATRLAAEESVYYTLNPIPADLGRPARVADVLRRRWILIDLDRKKSEADKNLSATDAEKEAARLVADSVRSFLAALGWPDPVLIDSGNGWHLLYRIDLPNDAPSQNLLRSVLNTLAERFDTDAVEVDRKVHNASRVAKLPGCWSYKGADTPDRPHRPCRLLLAPETVIPVSSGQLHAMADIAASPLPATPPLPPSPFYARATDGNGDSAAYGKKALDNEAGKVAMAPAGDRNEQLFRSAAAVGELVAGGVVSRSDAETVLCEAARRSGLYDDATCGEAGVLATVKSGLNKGASQPRTPPGRNGKGSPHRWPDRAGVHPPPDADALGLAVTCARDIKPQPLYWLVPNTLPLGKLVLVAGDGGHGKSTWTLALAADLSCGRPALGLDYEVEAPAEVLIACCEDDWADTVVPRLMCHDADLSKIYRVDGIRSKDGGKTAPFTLEAYEAIERELEQRPLVRMVVIDPAGAYVGKTGIDDHKDSELRALLGPLAELSARRRVTIPLVKHLVKGATSKAVHKVGGSMGYVNAVRAAFVVVPHADDETLKLFLPLKFNLGPKPEGMSYRLAAMTTAEEDAVLDAMTDLDHPTRARMRQQLYRIRWEGPVDIAADDAFNPPGRPEKIGDCVEWLLGFLAEYASPSNDVIAAAQQAGYSEATVWRAKKDPRCSAINVKHVGPGRVFAWGLGPKDQWKMRSTGVSEPLDSETF